MSRRKQGRPQQRKALDSVALQPNPWCPAGTPNTLSLMRNFYSYLDTVEQEKDLLVCGDCQTSFALHDIVHFIRHKKQCCDKENNIKKKSCRKPDSNNDGSDERRENDATVRDGDAAMDDDDADEERNAEDGVVMNKRRSDNTDDDDEEEEDEDGDDEDEGDKTADDDEGADDENNVRGDRGRKRKRKDDGDDGSRERRTPLRPKQVVDAESNTTHSEPSRFVCETCRSTYTSAWGLLQHAQKEHGMKIYTSPSSSTSSSPAAGSASTPGPHNNMSPIDLVMGSSPRSSGGMASPHHSSHSHSHHRSSSTGSGGSASPFHPSAIHPPNPFTSPFRLPLDTRLPHPTSLSPFSRPIEMDLMGLPPQFLARAGPPGLDRHGFHPGALDHSRGPLSHADFYSMRLKQLARTPVIAATQPRVPFPATSQPQPPSMDVPAPSGKSVSPSVEAASTLSPKEGEGRVSDGTLPPKLKSCEFCGKSFRFQSNLVVHRRSHTGEKPFKCPVCPHACTQQSKLKRHMKTHNLKPEGATSPNGTPVNDKAEDEDDEEEEEELEGEEEEEEEIEEAEMNDEEREVLEQMKAKSKSEQAAPEPGEILHEAKRIKLENGEKEEENQEDDEEEQPSDLSMKSNKKSESVVSDIMEKTGLTSIHEYNEAFKAALAERQVNGKDVDEKSVSRDGADTPTSSNPASPTKKDSENEKDGDKLDQSKERLFLSATDLLHKAIKREEANVPTSWPSNVESIVPGTLDPAAYNRLHRSWLYPDNPVRLFFPGFPPHFPPHPRDLSLSSETSAPNGLSLTTSTTASSALKQDSPSLPALFKQNLSSSPAFPAHHRGTSSSSSSSPTTNLLLPTNGGSAGVITPPRNKDSRRNDTCEYCGKVFKNCSNLTVHRRSHTGEKPYKCNLCSYACAQSSKLTRHMKTHGRLGKDVYTCKFCQMPFSVPSTLEKHMRKCVENRTARLLNTDAGDLSSESNSEMAAESPATGVY